MNNKERLRGKQRKKKNKTKQNKTKTKKTIKGITSITLMCNFLFKNNDK